MSCLKKMYDFSGILKVSAGILKQNENFGFLRGWLLVVGFKADCLTRDIGLGGMPSVGVFLRDPSPYLREFRRKSRKTPNG